MKNKHFFNKFFLLAAVFLSCFVIFQVVYVLAEPGSQDDPVIVKSYIDQVVIPQIKSYIDERIESLSAKIGNMEQNQNQKAADRFVIVSLKPGQKLIGEEGTELILRRGTATVIASETGGIADVTVGMDLKNVPVPPEHLLIIPRNDGRGIYADMNNQEDVLVMVKGTYIIKD